MSAPDALAVAVLPILKSVMHCDWLTYDERVELAQELTSAESGDQVDGILKRWEIGFYEGRLINMQSPEKAR